MPTDFRLSTTTSGLSLDPSAVELRLLPGDVLPLVMVEIGEGQEQICSKYTC